MDQAFHNGDHHIAVNGVFVPSKRAHCRKLIRVARLFAAEGGGHHPRPIGVKPKHAARFLDPVLIQQQPGIVFISQVIGKGHPVVQHNGHKAFLPCGGQTADILPHLIACQKLRFGLAVPVIGLSRQVFQQKEDILVHGKIVHQIQHIPQLIGYMPFHQL
ncbi:hypothetical protein D3C75_889700 [compost metagenome]